MGTMSDADLWECANGHVVKASYAYTDGQGARHCPICEGPPNTRPAEAFRATAFYLAIAVGATLVATRVSGVFRGGALAIAVLAVTVACIIGVLGLVIVRTRADE